MTDYEKELNALCKTISEWLKHNADLNGVVKIKEDGWEFVYEDVNTYHVYSTDELEGKK